MVEALRIKNKKLYSWLNITDGNFKENLLYTLDFIIEFWN
jgi:hypothetical protein